MTVVRYLLIIVSLAVTILVFGWMAPRMVSAKSTSDAITGLAIIFVLYPAAIAMLWKAWKSTCKPKGGIDES